MSTVAAAPMPIDHAGVCCLLRRRLELARKHSRDTQARHERGAIVKRQQERAETEKLCAQVQQNDRQATAKKKTPKKNGESGHERRSCSASDAATFGEGALNPSQV